MKKKILVGPYGWLHTLPGAVKANPTVVSFLLGLTHNAISRIFYLKLFLKKLKFVFFGYLFASV